MGLKFNRIVTQVASLAVDDYCAGMAHKTRQETAVAEQCVPWEGHHWAQRSGGVGAMT
jgi:hypothetical protein